MTTTTAPFRIGQTLIGPLFNEPMRVETVSLAGGSSWALGQVGAHSERFRRVTLCDADLGALTILSSASSFDGEANLLRLYVVTHCNTTPRLREPIKDPARLQWTEVVKAAHYRIDTQGLPGGGA
jgi:hypothetical protein